MRRGLDHAAVNSIAVVPSASSAPKIRKIRKTVSFSDLPDAQTRSRQGDKERTPPRRARDLPRLEKERPGAEDQARRNLSRLVANHRQVADSWTWTTLWDCHNTFGRAVRSCLPEQNPSHHAAIVGDVMFIGCQPGVAEDALMLKDAEVSVEGATVSISNKGMPTVLQTLPSPKEAEHWASKVRAAADLWQEFEELTEAALHAQRQSEVKTTDAGSGGTTSPGTPAPGSSSASSTTSCLKKSVVTKPAQGDLHQSPSHGDPASRPWVGLTTKRCVAGEHAAFSAGNGSSNWRWMLALFQGAPPVVVA